MNENLSVSQPRLDLDAIARSTLNASTKFWFITTVTGQWLFAFYIIAFYGGSALTGNFNEWENVLPTGLITGDTVGNIALATHLLLTAIITIGGPLQLIPQIRNLAPTFHRWNGRIYIITAIVTSLSGVYMVWTRGAVGGISQHVSITINAVLIVLFAILVLKNAMAGQISIHRRWALRLFLAVSGVWFFRVGLMLWLLIHQAPVGFDENTFSGPFLTFLAFSQYLIPLAILEIYFLTQKRAVTNEKIIYAGFLFLLTLAMAAGIFAAFMALWLPNI